MCVSYITYLNCGKVEHLTTTSPITLPPFSHTQPYSPDHSDMCMYTSVELKGVLGFVYLIKCDVLLLLFLLFIFEPFILYPSVNR